MKAGDKVVLMFALIPAERWEDTKIPQGSFAQAIHVGNIEDLTSEHEVKGWGSIIVTAVVRVARKLCPEMQFKI